MKKYWTMLTKDYLSHWTAVNGVREYVSNALDSSAPFEYEFGDDFQPDWVHVSYKSSGNRKEVLRAKKVNGKTVYEKYK